MGLVALRLACRGCRARTCSTGGISMAEQRGAWSVYGDGWARCLHGLVGCDESIGGLADGCLGDRHGNWSWDLLGWSRLSFTER